MQWFDICNILQNDWCYFLFLKIFTIYLFIYLFTYLFLDRGEGREKERERNINVWLPLNIPPAGDLAYNPGNCPDWESNWWPLGW